MGRERACASAVKRSRLRRCTRVLDLYFDIIGLVVRDRKHSKEIRRPNEEVSVELRHAQA